MSFTPSRTRPLVDNTTQAGTDADTNEKTLATFSLRANTLAVNGEKLRIEVYGTRIGAANADVVKLKFGALVLTVLSSSNAGKTSWYAKVLIVRTGAATQKVGILSSAYRSDTIGEATHGYTTATETLSGAITISVTGQNGAATANSLVFEGLHVTWEAAAP